MKPASAKRELKSEELRRAFDASFALPARAAGEELEDLITIRVCSDDYALRGRELSGVAALRKLTSVPSSNAELLGIVAVRGVLVPVFGLSLVLGYPADSEPARWLALVGTEEPLAFAFHALTGFMRLPKSAFSALPVNAEAGERQTVSFEQQTRVVIGVPALVTRLRSRLGREVPKKEAE